MYFVVATVVLVCGLVSTIVALAKESKTAVPLKMVASTAFLWVAWLGGALDTTYGRIMLAALVLCWIGDLLLAYTGDVVFLAGLVSFLTAHLLLMAAFVHMGLNPLRCIVAAAAVAVPGALIFRWLRPHLPAHMRLPVFLYMLVISAMVVLSVGAFGRGLPTAALVGAMFFYVSDILVARQQFVAPGFSNAVIGLPLYYAAVWALAFSVAFHAG